MSSNGTPKIPKDLSPRAAAWWRKVTSGWDLEDHHYEQLRRLVETLDYIDKAKATLDAEGLIVYDRFNQAKEHPAAKSYRDFTILFNRTLRELALDDGPAELDVRPPRVGGKS